ncbi:DUF5615 family PIN-like protein [Crocosphaera watsonii WH 8501]|uniref:DUF5615 domain-containing protein n=5 Tax=Crocosphaera watsonii TaxID=263511 RepID=Q4C5Q7_CROWT|nr:MULTISPECIES: DUF5615 family PIN-like protein [Crocosphaera]EAM51357.1 hypothetical protein CwatDRAFT_4478 [Crocosphaera watsonii WH 8501]EHJ13459.1 hypothetical protein CWATWH0003_1853 [Crocosphaera watsonii WH 0003]MCH2245168.1 DUF5615 family PIN-like protein [Crocosphaera sp.]NQZ61541.1 DUF5615 family PIN-like protein [Crocosphaera sp.]CCQ49454.1 hypothetical protein CWATWH8502_1166 [Crocosphaera watsonii WH 8502]
MSQQIKYHLDENVDPDIALALRSQGIDVTTTFEMNMAGTSDNVQLAFVKQEKRVIVTHDTDFLKITSHDSNHYGVAFSKKGSRSMGDMIRTLILIYEVMTPEEMKGTVEYL